MAIITQIEDLQGKVLIAASRVPVKSGAWDDSPVLYHVEAGQPLGKIWSWLEPTAGRSRLHFMFERSAGDFVYTVYKAGYYDEVNLKDQIEAAKPKEPATILSTVSGIGTKAVGAYVAVQIIKALVFRK